MKNKGITLIEVLAVIAIILIVTTVTWVALYRSIPHNQLFSANEELISAIKDAQSSAVKTQDNFIVRFDVNNKKYSVIEIVNDTEHLKGETILPNRVSISAVNLTNNQVIFNSSGSVEYSGSIQLTNTLSETRTIQINSSGFISNQ